MVKSWNPAPAGFALKIRQNPAPAGFLKSKSGTALVSALWHLFDRYQSWKGTGGQRTTADAKLATKHHHRDIVCSLHTHYLCSDSQPMKQQEASVGLRTVFYVTGTSTFLSVVLTSCCILNENFVVKTRRLRVCNVRQRIGVAMNFVWRWG